MTTIRRRELLLASGGLSLGLLASHFASAAGLGNGWPQWRRQLRAMRWGIVPTGNTLPGINPARDPALNPRLASNPNDDRGPWGGVLGMAGIIVPWCGACYDRDADALWLPLGGGHADYAGNEAYTLCLADELPTWRMPRPPSGSIPLGLIDLNDGQEASGDYADGRPRAIHSYNKHCYVPGLGPLCTVQGSTAFSGQAGTARTLLLNEMDGEWSTLTSHPAMGVGYGAACYDSSLNRVWWLGAGTSKLSWLDLDLQQWNLLSSGSTSQEWSYHALTHVPGHEILVQLSDDIANGFAVWDISSGQRLNPGVDNTRPAHLASAGGKAGGVWVPSLNAIALWHNTTLGSTGAISLLRAPDQPRDQPWSWDSLALLDNAVLPSTAQAAGTYGRFGYAPNLDGFYLLNSLGGPLLFFALSDGNGVFASGFEQPA
ncbi:hypothetical protein [Pseudomarimonas arenosa]|uniref:Secreted protein n=1 Tax=Pseudomarimonas arenosa TaxID=2774145 RepID=A0AAW3ZLU9_9GAMM|nr:hypothetical protein [Pseudomarimonas arenosa]MBD8525880.1 hypothetical protein [Pseudomarimonas arenosa]